MSQYSHIFFKKLMFLFMLWGHVTVQFTGVKDRELFGNVSSHPMSCGSLQPPSEYQAWQQWLLSNHLSSGIAFI